MSPLSPRDAACLRALSSLPARAARKARLEASGLEWGQWRRALASLLSLRLVESTPGDRVAGESDALTLTVAGREALTLCRRHTSVTPRHTSSAHLLESSLSFSNSSKSKEKEREEGMPVATQGGVPARVVVVRVECAALDRLAAAVEARNALVEKCACGRVIITAKGPHGEYRTCPAKKQCPYATKGKPATSEARVSSGRSEREREQRQATPKSTNEPGLMSKAQTLVEAIAAAKKVP